ncbi:hypothetical protein [Desulfovibrio falkowii]
MPELNPCPICSSLSVGLCPGEDEITHEIYNQAFCTSCGVSGPRVFADEISAIAAWNSMPSALRWTHEPPKVAGWYWWRDVSHKGEATIQYMSQSQVERLKTYPGEEWAGPILTPRELEES